MRATCSGATSGRSAIFTSPVLSASTSVFSGSLSAILGSLPCFGALDEPARDIGCGERCNIAAQDRNLLYEFRGDRLMTGVGHQENRVDIGIEPLVHAHHLELI